jgi:hypothetical protein
VLGHFSAEISDSSFLELEKLGGSDNSYSSRANFEELILDLSNHLIISVKITKDMNDGIIADKGFDADNLELQKETANRDVSFNG